VKFESIITVSFIYVLGLENLCQILLEGLKIHLPPQRLKRKILFYYFCFLHQNRTEYNLFTLRWSFIDLINQGCRTCHSAKTIFIAKTTIHINKYIICNSFLQTFGSTALQKNNCNKKQPQLLLISVYAESVGRGKSFYRVEGVR
jgi:hypothetical protein